MFFPLRSVWNIILECTRDILKIIAATVSNVGYMDYLQELYAERDIKTFYSLMLAVNCFALSFLIMLKIGISQENFQKMLLFFLTYFLVSVCV